MVMVTIRKRNAYVGMKTIRRAKIVSVISRTRLSLYLPKYANRPNRTRHLLHDWIRLNPAVDLG